MLGGGRLDLAAATTDLFIRDSILVLSSDTDSFRIGDKILFGDSVVFGNKLLKEVVENFLRRDEVVLNLL